MPEPDVGTSVPRRWEPQQALEQLRDVARAEPLAYNGGQGESVGVRQVEGDSLNVKSLPPPHPIIAGGCQGPGPGPGVRGRRAL